jgi:hypothetical protein
MTQLETEWYTFMLPFATIPPLLLTFGFYKFVVPAWFASLEDNDKEE